MNDHIPIADDLDVHRSNGKVALVGSSSSVEFDEEIALLVAKCIEVVSDEGADALTPDEQRTLQRITERKQEV